MGVWWVCRLLLAYVWVCPPFLRVRISDFFKYSQVGLGPWIDPRAIHLAQKFIHPEPPNPSAWTPGFGKNTGPAFLPALFKPSDSIALDDPSENSVAFPPTPPDRLHSHLATLLVLAALIAAVCHERRTKLSTPDLQPILSTLNSARKHTPSLDATVSSARRPRHLRPLAPPYTTLPDASQYHPSIQDGETHPSRVVQYVLTASRTQERQLSLTGPRRFQVLQGTPHPPLRRFILHIHHRTQWIRKIKFVSDGLELRMALAHL